MATITFTNLTVSGNMGFKEISFDAFWRILDFIEAKPDGGNSDGGGCAEQPKGETVKNIVPDEKPTVPEGATPKTDPYSLVGNYAGKDSVVQILKAYAGNPTGYVQEWMTTRRWMEKVKLNPSVTLFSVAHILSDCARVGILERRADYNTEEHKNEVRFLLPVPVLAAEEAVDETPVIRLEDKIRGDVIRKARMDAGFSVAELAELLHTDGGTVVKWESGEYRITGSVEEDLKKLFGNGLFDGAEG